MDAMAADSHWECLAAAHGDGAGDGTGDGAGGGGTGDDRPDAFLAWKSAAVLAWLVLLFLVERLRPAAPRPTGEALETGLGRVPGVWRRVGRNLALWLMNAGLSPLVVLPVSLLATQHALGSDRCSWGRWMPSTNTRVGC